MKKEKYRSNKYEEDQLIYDPEEINIATREPTIEQLLRRVNEGALDLAPDFQRHANIWKEEVKSRLIESIIIRIPLPAFYIDATYEDKWLVVDGLQRLFALKQFVTDKELKLCGLEYLINLNGKTFDELTPTYQRRILETQVTVSLIQKGTPPEVKFNIFKRINTGGEPLSPQELRHALNPGKAPKFLAKLAESEEFIRVIDLSPFRKMRMEDREFILGFLAFSLTSYDNYKNVSRNSFLNGALKKINDLPEPDIIRLESKFKKAMNLAWEIFGEKAFRKLSKANDRSYPLNKALFEAWSVSLSNLSDQEMVELRNRKEKLIDKFRDRIDNDGAFRQSISQASDKVECRFRTIEELIREVLL